MTFSRRLRSRSIALVLLALLGLVACGDDAELKVPLIEGPEFEENSEWELGSTSFADEDSIESAPFEAPEEAIGEIEPVVDGELLRQVGNIHGEVFDTQRRRAANLTVVLTNAKGETVEATTDRRGRFTFSKIIPGQYFVAARSGELFADAKVRLRPRQRHRVRLTLGIPLRVTYTVIDDRGEPIEGATIALTSNGEPLAGETDAHGSALFDRIHPNRRYTVSCIKESHSFHQGTRRLRIKKSTTQKIVLERHVTLRGRVVDETGETVAGIDVAVPGFETKTDAEGDFELHGKLPRPSLLTAWTQEVPRRLAVAELSLAPGEDEEGLVLVLRKTGTIRGATQDFRGAGVPAKLSVSSPDPWYKILMRLGRKNGPGSAFRSATKDGSFVLAGIPLWLPLNLSIKASGFQTLKLQRPFDDRSSEWDLGTLRMVQLGLIHGIVLDQGTPVPHAEVVLRSGRHKRSARANAQGEFTFRSLSDSTYELLAKRRQTKSRMRNDLPQQSAFLLNLTASKDRPLENVQVHLVDNITVQGRVTGPDGMPLPKVQVRAQPIDLKVITTRTVRTNRDGAYTMSLTAGVDFRLSVTGAAQYGLAPDPRVVRGSPGARYVEDFALANGIRLVGTIRDANGSLVPVTGIWLRKGPSSGSVNVDKEGNYRSRMLEPGRYVVFARSNYDLTAREEIDVPENPRGGDLRLDLTMRPAPAIQGVAYTASGATLANKSVEAVGLDDPNVRRNGKTDARGNFFIRGFYPGRYSLQVKGDRNSRQETSALAPGETLTQFIRATR